MKMRKLDWNDIKEIYGQNNIDVLNYQINDSDPEELTEKIIVAADILNKLIRTYHVLYYFFLFYLLNYFYEYREFMCIVQQE